MSLYFQHGSVSVLSRRTQRIGVVCSHRMCHLPLRPVHIRKVVFALNAIYLQVFPDCVC